MDTVPALFQFPRLPRLAVVWLLLAVCAVGLAPGDASVHAAATPNDAIGIDHISYGNESFDPKTTAERYRWARESGAGWNRWVLYWHEIEQNPGVFDFGKTDATVAADSANGLKVLGILMGTPYWAAEGATTQGLPPPAVGQRGYPEATRLQAAELQSASPTTFAPRGLDQPAFADGTDTPAVGKPINENNPWARYVQRAVSRYKGKITAWEIWNEPDFRPVAATNYFGFWSGSIEGYARILKVAHAVIRATDPSATVVMGGMAYWFQQDYFPRLLAVIARDPSAAAHGFYFDATAWHWYGQASLLYDRTLWVREHLRRYGLQDKRIWITETMLSVCDDPPSKERDIRCDKGIARGNPQHQADFVWQALAYAFAAGVERVFLFQLYDDGHGPGENHGLIRNDNTPRPAFTAAKTAIGLMNGVTEAYKQTAARGKVELVTLVTAEGRRVRVAWSRGNSPVSISLPAEGSSLARVEGAVAAQPVAVPAGGAYMLALPPATLDYSGPSGPPEYIVGGITQVLVEEQAFHQWTVLEGTATDVAGRPLGGVQVRVGPGTVTSDAQGRYRIELRPGLYDVSTGTRTPGPLQGGVLEAVPVWSSRPINVQNVPIAPVAQRFLPILQRKAGG